MFSLERDCLKQTEELTSTKTLIQEGNYKIDNFDAVQRYKSSVKIHSYNFIVRILFSGAGMY